MGNATPGWYIDPEGSGQLRWWTGEAWTGALLAPSAAPMQTSSPKRRRPSRIIAVTSGWVLGLGSMVGIALLIAAMISAGVHGAGVSSADGSDSFTQQPDSERGVADEPKPAASPPKSADQMQDETQIAAGWSVIESGSVYGKFADKADYSCGYVKCSYFLVLTVHGCPSGLYVEASTLGGGTVVGMTNDMLSGVRAGETAAANLQIVDPGADSVRISKVECY